MSRFRDVDRALIERLDSTFYPDVPDNWDNDHFRSLVLPLMTGESVVLDVGAGRGALPQMDFRGHAGTVIGVDPDPVVLQNPLVHEAHVATAESMDVIATGSIDLMVSNNVLEHVPDPEGFFREASRVLRPDGMLVTKTPNRRHYMATIARLTPTSFHERVTAWRGRPVEDTFPTTYPANTIEDQTRFADAVGLKVEAIELMESRPEYLRITALSYLPGIAWERTVNRFKLDRFKIVMFSTFRKVD
ncbi:MAG: class I SAM-dependent methyltransferase [Actinomycetota bacterium]